MTYSIVARDPATGEMGVAVQTALPGVGTLCPWAEAGVGAVATQSLVRVSHGPNGLQLLRGGHTAPETLDALIAADAGRSGRQLGIVDAAGRAAAYTGEAAIRYAGHHIGEGFAVQANMMARDTVPQAMAQAYIETDGGLLLKMLAALRAAQDEGGDFRGQQSAALKIVSGQLTAAPWEGVLYDLRVDDHADPVGELRRIGLRQMAYKIAAEAETLLNQGQVDEALHRFEEAVRLDPDEEQMRFWFLLALADSDGQFERAAPYMRALIQAQPMWVECARRYAEVQPLKTEGLVGRIEALL